MTYPTQPRIVNSKLKILRRTIFAAIIILLLIINVPVPIHIDTYGLEIIYTNPDHLEKRAVTIRGWYSINVFVRHHGFRGSIIIHDYPETYGQMRDLQLTSFARGFRFDLLFYPQENQRLSDPLPFGMVYSRRLFSTTMIAIMHQDGLSLSGSPVIVLNASTHEDAMQTLSQLFRP